MSIRPIHVYGSPALREKAKAVAAVTPDTIKLVYDMFETMHAANGIGLAATQLGVPQRIVVIDITGLDEDEEAEGDERPAERRTSPGLPTVLAMINPEVLSGDGAWVMEEGCLSIPEVRGDVERAQTVRVRYKDTSFADQELVIDGLLARVALHEIDHLDGVLFIDHLSKTERGLLSGRLRKIKKGEVETSYAVLTPGKAPKST